MSHERKCKRIMKPSFRYLQSTGNEATTPPGLVSEQSAIVQTSEINRLLTAAVVNRRFCRLLLTNPLAALAQGYRGEAFRLNPEEVHRLSKNSCHFLARLCTSTSEPD